jgi:hypothetical protein
MENTDPSRHDWWEWHAGYDEPGSSLQLRTNIVHRHIRTVLDRCAPGERIRIVSPCGGQGRELLPVIATHPRRSDIRARLVELDARNVAAACDSVAELRLDWNAEIVCGDAAVTDAYAGAVPATLIVLCGILGCISSEDAQTTIEHLPELCASGASVVWTLQPLQLGRTREIRQWFADAGFSEEAFESPALDASWVGLHRFAGEPRPLTRGVRLFTFGSLVPAGDGCYVHPAQHSPEGRRP